MLLLLYNYPKPLKFEEYLLKTFEPYYKKFFQNDLQQGKLSFVLEDLLLLNQQDKNKVNYFIELFIELLNASWLLLDNMFLFIIYTFTLWRLDRLQQSYRNALELIQLLWQFLQNSLLICRRVNSLPMGRIIRKVILDLLIFIFFILLRVFRIYVIWKVLFHHALLYSK